jgi:pentose-5-phosphate-3-epimerase/CBS domain-containing protein
MNNFIHLPYISLSILAIEKKKRINFIKENNINKYVDYLHIDISDDQNSLTLNEVKKYKNISKVPLDVHIAMKNPNKVLSKIKLGVNDNCCIHVENNFSLSSIDKINKKFNFGLAINLETPSVRLKKYLNKIKYVLFMAAKPGISGLGFNDKVINKIKYFKKKNKNLNVHADGGVNNINSALLREEKVDLVVSGSYLVKKSSIKKQLHYLMGENYFKNISFFSTKKIPKIDIKKRIIDVLKKIDKFKLGIVLVYNKRKLVGIVSDGDIRRYLINGGNITDNLKIILNKRMFFLYNYSMINCFRKMQKEKSLSAIPILNKKGKCIAIYKGHK